MFNVPRHYPYFIKIIGKWKKTILVIYFEAAIVFFYTVMTKIYKIVYNEGENIIGLVVPIKELHVYLV